MATMKTLLLVCSVISLGFLYGVQGQRCPVGTKISNCYGCWSKCPDKPCIQACTRGCVCAQAGYLIGPNGKCIPEQECPKVKS
ncbi:chymotrypsin-elastase inhibitor ixodidin-like [Bufo gargarizans]|uniref:chymotrypsin-elastase inhibitor ixodidin-like n=1 Tax=Bufo gargarizans TaxID=30331 RepID=UPI001CF46B2A|nr:chymotrypsin-elastase inhibitor ixodidin-like [Bufo gargarizans]XP_044138280.1 chymotrypsin-elastase inhibitor ixodidin-like [Bufo gargarizans]XP_044138281.1 chymotrypsin-elastase inhibitor ixodidin-like [Bufo gargarizans]